MLLWLATEGIQSLNCGAPLQALLVNPAGGVGHKHGRALPMNDWHSALQEASMGLVKNACLLPPSSCGWEGSEDAKPKSVSSMARVVPSPMSGVDHMVGGTTTLQGV